MVVAADSKENEEKKMGSRFATFLPHNHSFRTGLTLLAMVIFGTVCVSLVKEE